MALAIDGNAETPEAGFTCTIPHVVLNRDLKFPVC